MGCVESEQVKPLSHLTALKQKQSSPGPQLQHECPLGQGNNHLETQTGEELQVFNIKKLPKEEQKLSSLQFLKLILKQFKQNSYIISLIIPEIFEYIQNRISKQYWPEQNKRQLIAILEEFAKKTFSQSSFQLQFEDSKLETLSEDKKYFKQKNMQGKQLGQAFMDLLNKIIVKNRWMLESLDLKQLFKQQYDLSDNSNEPLQFAKKVENQCYKSMLLIAYLSSYLMKCCLKMQKQGISLEEITRRLKSKATLLKNYFSVKSGEQIQATYMKMGTKMAEQSLRGQIKKKEYKYSPLIFRLQGTSQEKEKQIEAYIMKIVESAKNNHQLFDQIVKQPCIKKNGYGFKSNLKLSSLQNKMPLARVKEKLLSKFVEEDIKELKKSAKVCKTISEQFQMEDELIKQVMLRVYEKIQEVPFTVTDMLRGKCLFNNISQINAAAKDIMERIGQEKAKGVNVELVQIDNRLGLDKITQDLVFKIRIDNLICEFQMAISFSAAQNQIHHKMYEIDRSKTFSPLYVLNQWNKKAVKQYFQMLGRCINGHSFIDQKQKQNKIKQKEELATIMEYSSSSKENPTDQDYKYKYKKLDFINKNKETSKDQYQKWINTLYFWLYIKQLSKGEKIFEQLKLSKDKNKDENKFKKWSKMLQIAGRIKKQMGKLEQAKVLYNECLKLVQNQQSCSSILYANILHNLGQIEENLGKFGQALDFYYRSLEVKKNIIGEHSIECAETFNSIGLVNRRQGKYDEALQFFNKSLDIKKILKGEQSLSCAQTLNNIGILYQNKGNNQLALQFYNRSLDIKKAVKGEQSIDCASTLNNIGNLYQSQGNYGQALQFFNRSFDIKKILKGQHSIDCAETLNNIALVYMSQGNYGQALQFFNRSFDIKKAIKGEQSIDCAFILHNIGILHRKQGNNQKALQYFTRSLNIKTIVKGQKSIDCAQTFNNMGLVYQNQQNYKKALQYFNKSLEIKLMIKGQKSIDCASTLNNIGLVYQNQKNYEQALQFYNRSLIIYEQIKGKQSRQYITVAKNISDTQKAKQKQKKQQQQQQQQQQQEQQQQKSVNKISNLPTKKQKYKYKQKILLQIVNQIK